MSAKPPLDACGCCEPPAPATPLEIFNRPALTAIAYRAGDYPSFRQAMIQAIPRLGAQLAAELGLAASPLVRWTARQSDDYGIALLELWATLGDILTFYQERIANEAFLRTAVQRDSLRRLAAMLDYALNPGVAASTYLAYTLEAGASVTVPTGLRAQSVPQQGQTPQKYETVESITTRSELNRVRIYGQPVADNPLAAGRTSGTLAATSPVPVPGARLIVFRTSPWAEPEEKTVEKAELVEGRNVLTWAPAVRSASWVSNPSQVFVFKRTFRVFGVNAPSSYLSASGTTGTPPIITWSWISSYSFNLSSGSQVPLDGIYDDLKVGTRVLIRGASFSHLTTIIAVASDNASHGPLEGTVTVITLQNSIPNATTTDRRDLRIYELGDEIAYQPWATPATIPAGTSTLYTPYPALGAVDAGRTLVLDDAAKQPATATVTADGLPFTPPGGSELEFLSLTFNPPLARGLDPSTAYLLGNVARATHGETVKNEALGNGNAAQTFQSFDLKKAPVTHTASASAPGGALNSLLIQVNQVAWTEVPSLFGAGTKDRVYATEVDDDGTMTVRFGDGVTGARVPTGQKNVVATYRQGLGSAGNVAAGAISVALDRPVGLKAVTNPLAAAGGVDAETTNEARANAPNTVRTFDRAISLRDFEDLARSFAAVAKAGATWVWDGEAQTIHLTVAGANGAALSADDLETLRSYLDQRRDPNRLLLLDNHVPVAVVVAATIAVDAAYVNLVVKAAAEAALNSYFAFDQRAFGQAVHLSDVYAVLQATPGVAWVDVDALGYKDPVVGAAHGATADLVQAHMRINRARPNAAPPPRVTPAELAVIEAPSDIALTASGGLPA